MSAIKDFFKKKKVEAKFKLAGGGHKLGDAAAAQAASSASAAAAARQQKTAQRQHPSSSAQQAGAAALNRISEQQSKQTEEFQKNRQRALIKEQARRELEKEQMMEKEIEKLKSVYGEREPQEFEAPSQLAAQGVFFKCPLIGEFVLPREEMKMKIKEFLYSQLEQERGLTAVLIIHTCNSPRDKVQLGVDTLCKYIDNILLNPTEEKFRKIRKSNKAFKERVGSLEGSEEFLLACGFKVNKSFLLVLTKDVFYLILKDFLTRIFTHNFMILSIKSFLFVPRQISNILYRQSRFPFYFADFNF